MGGVYATNVKSFQTVRKLLKILFWLRRSEQTSRARFLREFLCPPRFPVIA